MQTPVARLLAPTTVWKSNTSANYSEKYVEYLKSEKWRLKRQQVLQKHQWCEKCLSARMLQVHHLHYRSIFNEDIDKDLIVLCMHCHEKLHKDFNTRPNKCQTLEVFTMIQVKRWRFETTGIVRQKTLQELQRERFDLLRKMKIERFKQKRIEAIKAEQKRMRQWLKKKKSKRQQAVQSWTNPKYSKKTFYNIAT